MNESAESPTNDQLAAVASYIRIGNSLLNGMIRLLRAEVIFAHALQGNESGSWRFKTDGPEELNINRLKSFENVTRAGYFVYATALFDTFLSDTTRFLLLHDLSLLGDKCLVPIGSLTSVKSREAIINKEVRRKVRDVGYESFSNRLRFIQNCGIKFDVSGFETSLKKLSDLRNSIVHDQSNVELAFNESQDGRVTVNPKSDTATTVSDDDLDNAKDTYLGAGNAVYQAVRGYLGSPTDEAWVEGHDRFHAATKIKVTKDNPH